MSDQYGPYRKFKYNLEELKREQVEAEVNTDNGDEDDEYFRGKADGLAMAVEIMNG